ncbi:MAG: M28 family peptidase [Bryobacteraceae bacterium]
MLIRVLSSLLICALPLSAQDTVDLTVLNHIKAEAFQNSQAMDHLFYISDVYGPRLTNSPGHRQAAEWAAKRLESYGLKNVKLEKWGPFGQSWQLKFFSAHLMEPQYMPLIGIPLAWTPGTNGVINAEPVMAVIKHEDDFAKYGGKLRGKVVLDMAPKEIEMSTEPMAHRLTNEEILARETVLDPSRLGPGFGGGRRAATPPLTPEERTAAAKFRTKVQQFYKQEGAVVVLEYGFNGDGGTVFATAGGSRNPKDPIPLPTVAVTPEHYNRIARLIAHNIPVKLQFDIQAQFLNDNPDSFNIVGEIPGTTKPDELVMLGGHFDSWHAATGATDNGTGSTVAIEAVRILSALRLPMARTVRIALWGGEEEGLLGSIAYVQEHFAHRDTMVLGPEYNKLSAYYNDDSGTGRFRGISVGGNDMCVPIFESWLAPLKDLEADAVVGRTGALPKQPGGTDSTSFSWIGLPGFGFMQDPMEYGTRTHHSNMDFYDRVQKGDVMQSSAIMAWFVYNTATRAEMMPRMPMPKATKKESL